jgi:glucans biosynthesis protein
VQFNYRIVWSLGEPPTDGFARVVNTREGNLHNVVRGRLFWVDFVDENFARRDPAELEAEVEVSEGGRVRHHAISAYPQIGGWRVAIETDAAEPGRTLTIRCRLRANEQPISETWVYNWKS